jgi:hypothetical protein
MNRFGLRQWVISRGRNERAERKEAEGIGGPEPVFGIPTATLVAARPIKQADTSGSFQDRVWKVWLRSREKIKF